jgi:hypothetical protein
VEPCINNECEKENIPERNNRIKVSAKLTLPGVGGSTTTTTNSSMNTFRSTSAEYNQVVKSNSAS